MSLFSKYQKALIPDGISDNQSTSQKAQRAFDIHKDADALLHQRLSSFMTSQSIFMSGFIIFTTIYIKHDTSNVDLLLPTIPVIAIAFCIVYLIFCRRLVRGMEVYLKYVLWDEDIIYRNYIISARWSKRNGYNLKDKNGSGYSFVLTLIWMMIVFWVVIPSFVFLFFRAPSAETISCLI